MEQWAGTTRCYLVFSANRYVETGNGGDEKKQVARDEPSVLLHPLIPDQGETNSLPLTTAVTRICQGSFRRSSSILPSKSP